MEGGARGSQFSQSGGRDLERVATSSFPFGPVGGERGGRGGGGRRETTGRIAARERLERARSLRTCAWIFCLMTWHSGVQGNMGHWLGVCGGVRC